MQSAENHAHSGPKTAQIDIFDVIMSWRPGFFWHKLMRLYVCCAKFQDNLATNTLTVSQLAKMAQSGSYHVTTSLWHHTFYPLTTLALDIPTA